MNSTSNSNMALPNEIKKAVSKSIYSYSSISKLEEDEIIKLVNILTPFCPLSDDEKKAIITLQEWVLTREISNESGKSYKQLHDLIVSGVSKWADFLNSWSRDLEYKFERYYKRNRELDERCYKGDPYKKGYPTEKIPSHLYKELRYGIQSGDPDMIMDLINRLVVEAMSINAPFIAPISAPNISPPSVNITPEVVEASKEHAKQIKEELSKHTKNVASAKQCLTEYIYNIVAEKKIFPDSK